MTHVVVLGGGISGLVTALRLRQRDIGVTILEASARFGGKLDTVDFAGKRVDVGPDSFLTRVPGPGRLCEELGLDKKFTHPGATTTQVWSRGKLRDLPKGLVGGAPTNIVGIAMSGIVSRPGLARAALDFVLPRSTYSEDPTVGEIVRKRFGDEIFERLVDPIVGGIRSGSSDSLAAGAVAPELAAAAKHRSLYVGLRKTSAPKSDGPIFTGLEGGVVQIADALVDTLSAVGAVLRANTSASKIEQSGDRWAVTASSGDIINADHVVLAIPPSASHGLLSSLLDDEVAPLLTLNAATLSMTLLAYPDKALTRRLDATGFLIPMNSDLIITAGSNMSVKWPHLAGGHHIFRISAGRFGDDRAAHLGDEELVGRIAAELPTLLPLTGEPIETFVQRWPSAAPQFDAAARTAIAKVRSTLPEGLHLTGASYDGNGLVACIKSAEQTAAAITS